MKNVKTLFAISMLALCMAAMVSGCTLFGLKKQTDNNRPTNVDTIDAHLNKTAWAYLKARAYGSTTDTLFRSMYTAIIYSGIDTNEYIKPNRTYIFLNTASCKAVWAGIFPASGKAAKSWKDYAPADIKNYLLYLIVQGQYSHYNLPVTPVLVNTLAPVGTYATVPPGFQVKSLATFPNPNSLMSLKVLDASNGNTSDYPLYLNESNFVATSDLLATNGVVQVMAALVQPFILQ